MRKLFISSAVMALLATTSVHAKTPVCNMNLNPGMTDEVQSVQIVAPGVLDVCISPNEQILFLHAAGDPALNVRAEQNFGVIFFSSKEVSVLPTKVIIYTQNNGISVNRENALHRYELVVNATTPTEMKQSALQEESFHDRLRFLVQASMPTRLSHVKVAP